nr:MAG TPA: GcrA cell cycle regulator [Caudoviricetes sp.]
MNEGRWTKDDVVKLVAMLRDGRTTEEAAHALGRTVPAIWQYMHYHRQAFQGLPERRGGSRSRGAHMRGGMYMRRCHDCGAPTTDYRYPKCWSKLRSRGGYTTTDTVQDVETCRSTLYLDGSRI